MKFAEVSPSTKQALLNVGLDPEHTIDLVKRAYEEDLQGGEDATSVATIPVDHVSTAEYRLRTNGIIAGIEVAKVALELAGITDLVSGVLCAHDVEAGTVILTARGNTRAILLAERTSLNFLGHLSGIATLTRAWVDEVSEYGTAIRDTRKTTPGMRVLEKYAVRMGGGTNHRMSLSESALIKDNHVEAVGGVSKAFQRVRKLYPNIEIEVEVDSLDQLKEILQQKPDLVLLDNMSVDECMQAVEIVAKRCKLEASGGLTLKNAKAYAQTGVDYLAVGALTHSAPVLDIGLDLKAEI
jgi:nicotinate-nucleotide pyrophosphorylase (carboxylating)